MFKLLLPLILGSTLSFAGLINAIALTVNDDPITLYDIDKTMTEKNVNKSQAVSSLIDKVLYEQLIQKYNIVVDSLDIDRYIESLAKQNNMDIEAFRSIIKQKYGNIIVFEEEAKDKIKKQKLLSKIVRGQLKIADDEDIKLYYEKNKALFSTAETIEVIQYQSNNQTSLEKSMKNSMLMLNDVKRTNLNLDTKTLNPQLTYLLNTTKTNSFTPIFRSNNLYNTLFITKKIGTKTLDIKTVKNKIFADIMSKREQKYLKDYFEKEKLIADIKIVR